MNSPSYGSQIPFEDWDNLDISADYDTVSRKLTYKARLKKLSQAVE